MYSYICETPEVLTHIIDNRKEITREFVEEFKDKDIEQIYVIGSGTSYHAGLSAKNYLEEVLNMKFPFYDAPNTATITCCHILENGEPILYVSHDEDDGMWQFLCGKAHETDEAKLVSLKSVFDLDNSVGILKDMPCGYYAERKAQDDEWSVRKR